MNNSFEFLSLVLDSITDHIVVIDETGEIQYVNKSWIAFGSNNACLIDYDWRGVNYINECDKASALGDEFATHAGSGIRNVISKKEENFYLEYPCHSPAEKRWFMMRISSFQILGDNYFVISHQNITERKLAEDEVKKQARLDGLTQISNRRTFDNFLHEEWRRCYRLKKTICLAILDLDNFKLLNDDYGHQYGDDCLIRVGELLKEFANRPGDICARYGGEEFVLVWGDTSLAQAKQLSDQLLHKITELNIQNINSPTEDYLTASIGLAEMVPNSKNGEIELIGKADSMLYKAKDSGRNKVES
ncbi:sensor domain-containing diguanylate cyclase [Catenovulum adriaticum]|uniref:diguanylate cyclase n=1 Tax=Catenovulum adriaticum TaxID=2984846 RepID=A0ABY7ARR5_9ALTE|nr:sensor domain-containing diguanylate cyclase [Catenovulum sp. TS8]WAJ72230.1 sensor domain-containing diguanylate cyclase [Catenovulum sp. TS8]